MEVRNQTILNEFILVGFPQNKYVCLFLFLTFLLIYILTVLGNVFVIGTVILSPKLYLPMYFFLCNLSFIDLCMSSINLPKVILDAFSSKRTISVIGCMVQMNANIYLGGTESFLLMVMAYDRYMAIHFPLHYTKIINKKTCRNITFIMWAGSFFILIVMNNIRAVVFCTENRVNHFVCEILAVLPLMCGNIYFHKLNLLITSFITLVVPFIFIVVSYVFIISLMLKIQSNGGRSKAFSTCASHLTVVSMFYVTSISMYVGHVNSFSPNQKYYSLIYGSLAQALNPLIYTLKNSDVKRAFREISNKYFFQH